VSAIDFNEFSKINKIRIGTLRTPLEYTYDKTVPEFMSKIEAGK
jgi:hypothetical protein